MDSETVKSWLTQPDVCRCCLSANGTWDLTVSHINDGAKEVYSEMFLQCFGITLSRLTDWGPSRMICKLCVDNLRDACHFRNKVIAAESIFVDYLSKCQESDPVIKLEQEEQLECFEHDASDLEYDYRNENETTDTQITANKSIKELKTNKRNKRKIVSKRRFRGETKNIQDGDDSDTPIAALTGLKKHHLNNKLSADENKIDNQTANAETEKVTAQYLNEDKNCVLGDKEMGTKLAPKPMSEHKMVRLTCNIVLKYTNACPFRHHKSWFQCFYCLKEYRELGVLRKHTIQIHKDIDLELKKIKRYPQSIQIDITELKCLKCDANFDNIESLKIHFDEQHDLVIHNKCIADYKVDTSPYVCHICRQEFHVFRSLTMHLNDHYANCICDVCGKSFLNMKRMKVHKRSHENGLFPCTVCGEVLTTKTSKANHMEKHSKRILKCQICSEPMKHYNDRVKHMSEVHNITHKFKCAMCPREYNIRHYLTTHVRQTHGTKNKKCSECSMAFMTNHGLKKHMLKHTGEKPFSCSVCCKAYGRRYTLTEHMRSHENEKLNIL